MDAQNMSDAVWTLDMMTQVRVGGSSRARHTCSSALRHTRQKERDDERAQMIFSATTRKRPFSRGHRNHFLGAFVVVCGAVDKALTPISIDTVSLYILFQCRKLGLYLFPRLL